MKSDIINLIFERFRDRNPEPKTELLYGNLYQLLVAVVLSAQATDKGVNKATLSLFEKVKTPQDMLDLGEESLLNHIKTIGLFRSKGKNILSLSRDLVEKYQGQVPNNREALEALAGVGRKTANVVLNVGFGEKTMAVDTHIFRLSNRIGIAKGKNVLEVEKNLLVVIPDSFMNHAHHWLILHGRYICKAQNPSCSACFLQDICEFPEKNC